MDANEQLSEQTVRFDLSGYKKPERDLFWMEQLLEYGPPHVKIADAGLTLEVQLPDGPQLNEARKRSESINHRERHCGA